MENSPTPTKAIDYHSLEWMPKSVWGPMKWKELHCRALARLPMDCEAEWFAAYLDGLPCPECRRHFEQFVRSNPPSFESRPAFFRWTVKAHNFVNQAVGKPVVSLAMAREFHAEMLEPEERVPAEPAIPTGDILSTAADSASLSTASFTHHPVFHPEGRALTPSGARRRSTSNNPLEASTGTTGKER